MDEPTCQYKEGGKNRRLHGGRGFPPVHIHTQRRRNEHVNGGSNTEGRGDEPPEAVLQNEVIWRVFGKQEAQCGHRHAADKAQQT